MSKLGILLLTSMTLAWAGPGGGSDDAKAQPCNVTTRAGSHPCTAEEAGRLIAIERGALEMYQPRSGAKPLTMEEQGRALRLLLLGSKASPRATQSDGDKAKAAETLRHRLSEAAEASPGKPKPPKQ